MQISVILTIDFCSRIYLSYVKNAVDSLNFVEIFSSLCHEELVFLSYNCSVLYYFS